VTSAIESNRATDRPWVDSSLSPELRVDALVTSMTLREKVAQLYGIWVGADPDGPGVAPHQSELENGFDFEATIGHGLGQLTRAFGTNPIDAGQGAAALARLQRQIVDAGRHGIPALVHEECLAGFTTWGATAYPVPLSWGATFDPDLIAEMAAQIGHDMASVGVHQGLAPVLDVVRDLRWGRVEETIGEDPYLIGAIGTSYVRGLQSAGIVATLKHFAGYSASRAGRNLAPVSMGPREFADVILPPFEMAVLEGDVRSVMHSYAEVDGVPAVANTALLTDLLRDQWGFSGTVVADYFGIGFLKMLHGVADSWGDAARLALTAGVDVELPGPKAYADPLVDEVASGRVDEALVDRALRRVLRQKLDLGLLDADWDPTPSGLNPGQLEPGALEPGAIDLDSEAGRALARRVAEEAIVLVKNDGILPLAAPGRLALIGPTADDAMTMLGCYSFPSHVGAHHPELPLGVDIPTVFASVAAEFAASDVTFTPGCTVDGTDDSGIAEAVASAAQADVVVVALGDRAGLFGRGTSGEGCDAESLRLPGRQEDLLEALLDTGTPVVVFVDSGRPYSLGTAPARAAAIVQAFFPGEEGGVAVARVLSGAVNPSGRLPVSIPARAGGQPWTYLSQKLALASEVSNQDPTPAYPFGHGLGYTTFQWTDLTGPAQLEAATDGAIEVELAVANTGGRQGTEIVQLYVHDPVASVTRPVVKLVGFRRVPLEPGQTATVRFRIPADVTSFVGPALTRIVEPGELELRFGSSSAEPRLTRTASLTGPVRTLGVTWQRHVQIDVLG
jgi:beta-xylosidase